MTTIEEETTMKYDIFYRPVFTKKERKLSGYEMIVYPHDSSSPAGDFDVMTIEPAANNEFSRFENMLRSGYDPLSDVSFVDKHPLNIIRYLRGEKEMPKRTAGWEKDIDRWSVNLRGERV